MVPGGSQGIFDGGNAVGACFEHRLPLLGRQVDEEGHSCENFLEGSLDVGEQEACIDVLVWSRGGSLGLG
uniref:Uncharacterized protein n=1 Tax=Candidatus Kentrum sp. FW TaxID=2126338 RepID=A0A450TSS8_9GAMM|nr:MAG: hypothetical protein BECKFW1821C_GA0114237_10287 [Candidatus Kentron sp. FW]